MRYLRFFFFNDTATTEIYTLSLHDALPISRTSRSQSQYVRERSRLRSLANSGHGSVLATSAGVSQDRKSTRLNSSHANISYAVFCLKKKKKADMLQVYCIQTKKNNMQYSGL